MMWHLGLKKGFHFSTGATTGQGDAQSSQIYHKKINLK